VPEEGSSGPLAGVRVVELAGIGPGPFCVMLLADMGASVVRVDRVGPPSADYPVNPVVERGRRSVALDLKSSEGAQVVLDLVHHADVLLESYRPGVSERLGIGPEACHAVNERLVYARLSGFGQDGPWAGVVGHDINYIALTGALWSIGRAGERPVPPVNLVGDLGGAASSMAFGIVCALLEARSSGRGQVVDANVLDATATLMGFVQGLRAQGQWSLDRGTNLLDTGCPYYDTYACADGRWIAMGTVEERFFLVALDVLGFDGDDPLRRAHSDPSRWAALRAALTETFATRTRDEWGVVFRDRDACVTPVLDPDEATRHEQAAARGAYQPIPGYAVPQPAVAPRFGRSRTVVPPPPPRVGEHTDAVLEELGYAPERVASLRSAGVVA
jgi:alpha-methylacyl-CoA racemase